MRASYNSRMNFTTNPYWPKHAFKFFGGGASSGAPQQVYAPTPPVTQTAPEISQAKTDARRQASRRQGYASTLLAGETGGTQDQKKSLLGL